MKLYFTPPNASWWIESGAYEKWMAFLDRAPARGPGYELVDQPKDADFVIQQWASTGGSTLAELRPLSRQDVRTVVWSGADRPWGRESGFYCSLPRRLFDPTRHCAICYQFSFNDFIEQFAPEAAHRDFGFVGAPTAGVRRRLVNRFASEAERLNALIVETTYGTQWWNQLVKGPEPEKRSYADFMRTTKFVLCPRGQGTGTIRLFETLKAGRAPIIISDDYVLPTLRGPTRWEDGALFLGEHELERLPSLVRQGLDDWPRRALAARAIWDENFADNSVLAFIAANLANLGGAIRAGRANQLARTAGVAAEIFVQEARPKLGALRNAIRR